MSSFLKRTSAMSPSRRDVTSCRRRSLSSASISSTMYSISSSGTGRLAHALANPVRSLARSKASRVPSRLITISRKGSRRSYVVNRFPHERHSRRRRMASFPSERRLSITLVSWKSQYGHCTSQNPHRSTPHLVPWKISTPHFLIAIPATCTLTLG